MILLLIISLMSYLSSDVWEYISIFIISNIDKGRLMLTCKQTSECKIYFNGEIGLGKIMKSAWFNQFLNICVRKNVTILPLYVKRLVFNRCYNGPINFLIPSSVKILRFGRRFNQSIDGCIPNSVIELFFGRAFNQPINKQLPSSIKKLSFGNHFNQPIDICIPISIDKLKFGKFFSQSIDGLFFPTVTKLKFGEYFHHSLRSCFLPSLIKLDHTTSYSGDGYVPPTVTHLKVFGMWNIKKIPPSVSHLSIEAIYSWDPPLNMVISPSVTHLTLCYYDQPLENLKYLNVKEIVFAEYISQGCAIDMLPHVNIIFR